MAAPIEAQLAELRDFEQVVQEIHDICIDMSVLMTEQVKSVHGLSKRATAMDGDMETAKKNMEQAVQLKKSGPNCVVIAAAVTAGILILGAITAVVLFTVVL